MQHSPPPSVIACVGTQDSSLRAKSKRRGTREDRHKKKKGTEFSTPDGRRTSHETRNLSNYVQTVQKKWAEGTFRWVHKGIYAVDNRVHGHDGGPQNGQLCVLKEFKTGSVYEDCFFQHDLEAVAKADTIITEFNKCQLGVKGSKEILLNKPTIGKEYYPDSSGRTKRRLVEPMLEGKFLKFNSNSGFTNGAHFMQALSHFSYHHTDGKLLLCDLQGGHYHDAYVLTDPVIMSSANTKTFGTTDLGSEGISNFFAHHKCNRFCKSHWKRPHRPTVSQRIPCIEGSTMSLTIGSQSGRSAVAQRKVTLPSLLGGRQKSTFDVYLN